MPFFTLVCRVETKGKNTKISHRSVKFKLPDDARRAEWLTINGYPVTDGTTTSPADGGLGKTGFPGSRKTRHNVFDGGGGDEARRSYYHYRIIFNV